MPLAGERRDGGDASELRVDGGEVTCDATRSGVGQRTGSGPPIDDQPVPRPQQ